MDAPSASALPPRTGEEPAGGSRSRPSSRPPLVVVLGNPNVGKTTLFNRLTGQNARVGNYPGVTVERRVGVLREGAAGRGPSPARPIELQDVPGTYSLSARSGEEQIALQSLLGHRGEPPPDLVLLVVDAGQLVRNLYLVVQVLELGVPVVVALNMIDEVESHRPDPAAVSALLGVPVVPTDARRGLGVEDLTRTLRAAIERPSPSRARIEYPPGVHGDVDELLALLPEAWRGARQRERALALWALTSVEAHDELRDVPASLRARVLELQHAATASGRDIDAEIIAARYRFLDEHAAGLFAAGDAPEWIVPHPAKRALSEKIDRVLLHPVAGFAIFLGLMLVIFQSLFAWTDPVIRRIEGLAAALQGGLEELLPAGVVTDLLTQGVVAGVGNVLVFLPQILLLFLFIGLLEDSGYMARVAYLMDRIMSALGLHGRAFVPMLSGFACAVPAILATRTMERRRDRLLTMMVIPLMTCSARLPVYTLIIGALYPAARLAGGLPVQGLLMVAMYLFSIATTLVAAAVLGRTVLRGPRVPLILELPPYRWPHLGTTLRMLRDRCWQFVSEAGTTILACTVVLWALLYFPRTPDLASAPGPAPAPARGAQVAESYGGRLGRALEPVLSPLGFDWKIGVGLIGAFAAREVFVSTLGIIYGLDGDAAEEDPAPLRDRIREARHGDGRPVYTPLVGLSLMVFFALACQCMSTLAVTRRETGSWGWPAFMFGYMTAVAWVASFAVYQGGRFLGLG